jgi:hypothetical protein
VFNDTLSLVKTINPFEIREIITSNLKIKNLLNTIIVTDYKKKELKKYPNLNTILSDSEIKYLKTELKEADLILVPIALNFKSMGIYTFGYCKFRLYDLESGEFIFECSENMNVNINGENAMKGLTNVLISVTHDYYRDKFLKKIK